MDRITPALPHQVFRYLVVGFSQLGLDSLVYIVATAIGVPVVAANLLGRVAAVGLGFWGHGRWTFGGGGDRLRGGTLLRFLVAWAVLTLASTLLVSQIAASAGLRGSWLAKPLVEGVLAVASFLVLRGWVFSKRSS